MEASVESRKPWSWRDRLVGMGLLNKGRSYNSSNFEDEGDLELMAEDVEQSMVNGIDSIKFSVT